MWSSLGINLGQLFFIDANNLPDATTNLFYALYADDTNMLASGKDLNNLVSNLNNILLTVYDWLKAYKFICQCEKDTLYPRSFAMDRSLPIEFNGQQIQEVSETKSLGVILDNGLTWKAHIQRGQRAY